MGKDRKQFATIIYECKSQLIINSNSRIHTTLVVKWNRPPKQPWGIIEGNKSMSNFLFPLIENSCSVRTLSFGLEYIGFTDIYPGILYKDLNYKQLLTIPFYPLKKKLRN